MRLARRSLLQQPSHRVALASPSTQWQTQRPRLRVAHVAQDKPPFKLLQRNRSFLTLQMHAPTLRVLARQLIFRQPSSGDREHHRTSDSQRGAKPPLRRHPRQASSFSEVPRPFIERLLRRDSERHCETISAAADQPVVQPTLRRSSGELRGASAAAVPLAGPQSSPRNSAFGAR